MCVIKRRRGRCLHLPGYRDFKCEQEVESRFLVAAHAAGAPLLSSCVRIHSKQTEL